MKEIYKYAIVFMMVIVFPLLIGCYIHKTEKQAETIKFLEHRVDSLNKVIRDITEEFNNIRTPLYEKKSNGKVYENSYCIGNLIVIKHAVLTSKMKKEFIEQRNAQSW